MTNNLKAAKRETKTKGELNNLRTKGLIPAILYGGKSPNLKLSIEEKFVKEGTLFRRTSIVIGFISVSPNSSVTINEKEF